MLFVVALCSIIGLVQSFVSTRKISSAKLQMAFAGGLPGANGPEPGSKNFDPLKLAEKSPELVLFYREAEIKHGRIAMLATLGWIAADFVKLPGAVHDVDSLHAHAAAVQSGALLQVLFWTSLFELISCPAVYGLGKTDRKPGEFGFDPLGLGKKDWAKLEVNELKNGRLAMLAFSGIVTQAALYEKGFPCKSMFHPVVPQMMHLIFSIFRFLNN
jgi:light-harvesting complex I chlorophyll a/b binding protein 4